MSKNPIRPTPPAFAPVPTRARHDGWTPARQVAFIDALAASGCVAEACAAVGMGTSSAYQLRVRPEAQQFRIAWDAALDLAIRRLADECFSRALNGIAIPHYFQGEQVGEHRRYDDRLAMFLLRYRDPLRYAATLDRMVYSGHPEGAGLRFAHARNAVLDEAERIPDGECLPPDPPYAIETPGQAMARQERQKRIDEQAEEQAAREGLEQTLKTIAAMMAEGDGDEAEEGDGVGT